MDELNNSQILKFLIKNYEFLLGPEVFLPLHLNKEYPGAKNNVL